MCTLPSIPGYAFLVYWTCNPKGRQTASLGRLTIKHAADGVFCAVLFNITRMLVFYRQCSSPSTLGSKLMVYLNPTKWSYMTLFW